MGKFFKFAGLALAATVVALSSGCGKDNTGTEQASATPSFLQAKQGKPIPPGFDFSLLDQNGDYHQLSRYRDSTAIVLISHGLGCPIVRQSVTSINALAQEYQKKNVTFLMVNTFPQDSREEIQQEVAEYSLNIPVLMDDTQFISWTLNYTRTAEVLVIDPARWEILYRGPIDDRLDYEIQKNEPKNNYVKDFLDHLIAGNTVEEAVEIPFKGCAISYDGSYFADPKTYTEEVAAILENRCATCHTKGGIAPWAMSDYDTVKAWSFMMREVLKTRRMPPWHADDPDQHLIHTAGMPDAEKRTLLQWLSKGTPRGEGDDPLAIAEQKKATDEDPWVLGEPDIIISAGKFDIKATGLLPYKYLTIDFDNEKDLYVKAVHLRPTNKKVLHHGFAFVSSTSSGYNTDPKKVINGSWEEGVFATYVPGVDGEINPDNVIRYIPAHSKMKFELHFTPTGKEEQSEVLLGLYLTDKPTENDRFYNMDAIYDRWFRIPPGEADWPVTAKKKFTKDALLFEMMPHMHYRGQAMKYTLVYPDGNERLLLSVPKFDFNWQRQYRFNEPVKIPAGSEIVVEGLFDNSTLNPFNPDPTKVVGFGVQTIQEMFIGYIAYVNEE